jgi:ABC-2 type transport system ATP-binding protein
MSEMAQTATNLIIIGGGRLLADTTVSEFVRASGAGTVTVTSADPVRLREHLAGAGVTVSGAPGSEQLEVTGLTARQIGQRAADHQIAVYELTQHAESLEAAFMAVTGESVEYHGRVA